MSKVIVAVSLVWSVGLLPGIVAAHNGPRIAPDEERMRMAIPLFLAWLGTGVLSFAICCLIIFPPSRVTRAVMVSLFGATVVLAVLALTALPLGGMEQLYHYLAHRVLASVGELRTGVRPV